MGENEFAELIQRCLSGQATKEEVALLERWLDHRKEKDLFSRFSPSEKETIGAEIFQGLSRRIKESRETVKKDKVSLRPIVYYRAAVTILVLSVISYLIFEITPSPGKGTTAYVKPALRTEVSKKIILSDSSIVWLKGNSSISYPEKFTGAERNVELTGEALFEVSKDKNHPFVIQCGELTARVLGTSFNIKSSETHIEVLVLTGKVALSSKTNRNDLILLPNEKAVYDEAKNEIEKLTPKENEVTTKTAGTEYSMHFYATPMKDIAEKIERKFEVQVSFTDMRLANCTITADFTDQSLDRTLNMISQSLGIQYEINNKRVTLKGQGCD